MEENSLFYSQVYLNLEYAIKKSGKTKKEIANKLGVTASNLSLFLKKLKQGENISTKNLNKISKILEVPVEFFFTNNYN